MMTVPAPVGGWNAISALANMPQEDAFVLDNLIPDSSDVRSRDGHKEHTTTVRASPGLLVSYKASTPKLLLCGGGNIYDVTAGGAGTDLTGAITDFTNNQFIAAPYKSFIVFCNGADTPVVYNGTTVTAISATGPTMTEIRGAVTFKGRVIFWEKPDGSNPQSFWYAAAGAYQGTLSEYELTEFTKGGYVVQCLNWTMDGGAGMDDYFVVLMSTGEVLVYQGSDPGDANDWALVGVYQIGEPVGHLPATQVGGDNVVLTKDGYIVLSAAIREGRYSENSTFSYKINPAAQQATFAYASEYGWHSVLHPDSSLFVVNVPISPSQSQQHVRNTSTGAWCRWTGLPAVSFASHDGALYFASTDGKVYIMGGTSDNGDFIQMRGSQAYNYYGSPHQKKQVTAVEVQSNYAYPKYLISDFFADYAERDLAPLSDPPEPEPSDWDVGEWNSAQWESSSNSAINKERKNASGFGYALAHTLRLRSRAQRFAWYATHIYVKPAGVV